MSGVLGFLFLVIGAVLVYDVLTGKSKPIIDLLTGNTESLKQPERQIPGH